MVPDAAFHVELNVPDLLKIIPETGDQRGFRYVCKSRVRQSSPTRHNLQHVRDLLKYLPNYRGQADERSIGFEKRLIKLPSTDMLHRHLLLKSGFAPEVLLHLRYVHLFSVPFDSHEND